MTAREQLHAYIAQLEQRLRWSTVLRGFAILTGGALLATAGAGRYRQRAGLFAGQRHRHSLRR